MSSLMIRKKSKSVRRRKQSNRPNGPFALQTRSISLQNAPAAVSTIGVRRDITFGSFTERGVSGCRVSGTFPICSLGAGVSNGVGFYLKGGTRVSTIFLRPSDGTVSLSPLLYRLASCFSRYRVKQLGFHYDPIGSTASAVRMAFGFSADPLSPVLTSVTSYLQYNTLLATPFSRTFSPWAGWSMGVACTDQWLYNDPSAPDTTAANVRQEAFGVIACTADADPGVNYSYGMLSMRLVLDLLDPVPIGTSLLLANAAASNLPDREAVDTKSGSESSFVPVSQLTAGTPMSSVSVSTGTVVANNTTSINRAHVAPSFSGALMR